MTHVTTSNAPSSYGSSSIAAHAKVAVRDALARDREQLGRRVDAGHARAAVGGQPGGVPGAARDVEQPCRLADRTAASSSAANSGSLTGSAISAQSRGAALHSARCCASASRIGHRRVNVAVIDHDDSLLPWERLSLNGPPPEPESVSVTVLSPKDATDAVVVPIGPPRSEPSFSALTSNVPV